MNSTARGAGRVPHCGKLSLVISKTAHQWHARRSLRWDDWMKRRRRSRPAAPQAESHFADQSPVSAHILYFQPAIITARSSDTRATLEMESRIEYARAR